MATNSKQLFDQYKSLYDFIKTSLEMEPGV